MYAFLLGLHNMTRWLVLISGVLAIAVAVWGLLAKREWNATDKTIGVTFTSIFGVQVVLGLILYFVSPLYGVRAFGALDLAQGSARVQLIFFSMYHITMMLIAWVVAQLGYSRGKRAETSRQGFRRALLGYTLGFVLVFLAIPWGIRPNWRGLGGAALDSPQHLTLAADRTGELLHTEAQSR